MEKQLNDKQSEANVFARELEEASKSGKSAGAELKKAQDQVKQLAEEKVLPFCIRMVITLMCLWCVGAAKSNV